MTQLTPNEPAPFEHLQPVANQLLAELTERLYLSRESAPSSYHALANSLTMALLMTHAAPTATGDNATTAATTSSAPVELTATLIWLIKRLLTDHTYRAAQLVIHREKLKKCFYTAPRLFVAKPPAWLPASAYLMARADLDHYPRNGKWWDSGHWLTLKEPELVTVLASRLDHLLSELTHPHEADLSQPHPIVIEQNGGGVTQSSFNHKLNELAQQYEQQEGQGQAQTEEEVTATVMRRLAENTGSLLTLVVGEEEKTYYRRAFREFKPL